MTYHNSVEQHLLSREWNIYLRKKSVFLELLKEIKYLLRKNLSSCSSNHKLPYLPHLSSTNGTRTVPPTEIVPLTDTATAFDVVIENKFIKTFVFVVVVVVVVC